MRHPWGQESRTKLFAALLAIGALVTIGALLARRSVPRGPLPEKAARAPAAATESRARAAREAQPEAAEKTREAPEVSGIRDAPPPPDGSPAFQVVALETGKPLAEAWLVLRRKLERARGRAVWSELYSVVDEAEAASRVSGLRFHAGEDAIVRLALEALEGEETGEGFAAWEEAVVGAPGYPAHVFQVDCFLGFLARALPRDSPASGAASPSAIPVLGLHPGLEWAGRVLDRKGRPIAGARVLGTTIHSGALPLPAPGRLLKRLSATSEDAAVTDSEGRFRLRGLADLESLAELRDSEAEEYASRLELQVSILAEGFIPRELSLDRTSEHVVTLYKAVTIEGIVTDASGAPLGGAGVRFDSLREIEPLGPVSPDLDSFSLEFATRSDPDGTFQAVLSDELIYTGIAGKGGYSSSRIKEYRPRAGDKVAFSLKPWPKATVRLLSGETRTPVARSRVRVLFRRLEKLAEESTDEEGRLSFACPRTEEVREILFWAETAGFARLVVSGISDDGLSLGDVFLDPGYPLQVSVVDAAGEPIPGAKLRIHLTRAADAALAQVGPWGLSRLVSASRIADDHGRLAFEHLPAGMYELEEIQATRQEDTDGPGKLPRAIWAPSRGVVHVPESSAIRVSLIQSSRVKGTVGLPSGEVVASAFVNLIRVPGVEVEGKTDGSGRFSLEFVLPPEEMSAGADQEGLGSSRDRRLGPALRIYHERLRIAELPLPRLPAPGEELDLGFLELPAPPEPATLIVEVPLAPEPPPDAEAGDETEDGVCVIEEIRGSFSLDKYLCPGMGEVSFDDLDPGTYQVTVQREGFIPWRSAPVTLGPGEVRRLHAALDRGDPIRAIVLDAETGRPIAGAEAVLSEGLRAAMTGEDGRFELRAPPGRAFVVTVSADGYEGASVVLRPGENLHTIRLMQEEARGEAHEGSAWTKVWFEVARADGLPFVRSGGIVEWKLENWETPRIEYPQRPEDADDIFWVSIPPVPGPHIRVSFAGYLPTEWIPVRAGEGTSERSLRLALEPAPPLTVLVTDPKGTPVPGVEVTVSGGSAWVGRLGPWSDRSSVEGIVRLGPLVPGTYEFRALVPEGLPFASVVRRIEYDGHGGPVKIALEQSASLEVRLLVDRNPDAIGVYLDDEWAKRVAPGRFAFPRTKPGERELEAWAVGGVRLASRAVYLGPGEERTLEWDLSELAAIEGRLASGIRRDSLPLHASVVLAGPGDVSGKVELRWDGTFSFPRVPPGRYRLHLLGFAPFGSPPGSEIEVAPGEVAEVEIGCGTRILRGVVRGADGRPVRGARLTIENAFGDACELFLPPGGSFAFEGLPEGPQVLRFEAPGYLLHRMTVPPHGDQAVEVTLSPGILVRGTVQPFRKDLRVFWRAPDGTSGLASARWSWSASGFEATVPPSAEALVFTDGKDLAPDRAPTGPEEKDRIVVEVPLRRTPDGTFEPVGVIVPPKRTD